MRKIYFAAALVASSLAFAQTEGKVGLNTSTPEATLEIKPSATNAATSATTKEGILIPRVSRLRASNMGIDVTESTMVYISDVSDGSASGTTADVDAKGFYYFDGTKWVKMKGSSSGSSGGTLQDITGNIREVSSITAAEWAVPGTFGLIQTGTGTITLPAASAYANKVISVNNQSNSTRSYTSPAPKGWSSLTHGMGHLLMSDGTNWYIIGGSY